MTHQITIPLPNSQYPTRIEVYYQGVLNRHGGVAAGTTERKIKLPAAVEECEIRIIPCDERGKPVGSGQVYIDTESKPVAETDPPESDEVSDECGKDACESSEIVANTEASVAIARPEVDENIEPVFAMPTPEDQLSTR
ncbi:MAG: hypothetical protein ACW99J_19090 [Candidatus Thorarchaeota archaeon]|jgi:hypothetical protein